MSVVGQSQETPAHRVRDIPRMQAEMQRAIRDALREHKRAGNPVAVWRNERVEWIQPADIPVDDEPAGEEA